MATIRVLFAIQPRIYRELLTDLFSQEADIEVVGYAADPVELLVALQQTEAQVVVMASPTGEMPPLCTHLFAEFPGLLVVVLSADAQQAQVYRQQIVSQPVLAHGGKELASSIRVALEAEAMQ